MLKQEGVVASLNSIMGYTVLYISVHDRCYFIFYMVFIIPYLNNFVTFVIIFLISFLSLLMKLTEKRFHFVFGICFSLYFYSMCLCFCFRHSNFFFFSDFSWVFFSIFIFCSSIKNNICQWIWKKNLHWKKQTPSGWRAYETHW